MGARLLTFKIERTPWWPVLGLHALRHYKYVLRKREAKRKWRKAKRK